MALLWTSYILQYALMVAACFFLWKESYFAFLAFAMGAYIPIALVIKWDKITDRFNDLCQASAPGFSNWMFKLAVFVFIAALFMRRRLGENFTETLLAGYSMFMLTCALRDFYLFRYCLRHWHERHQ